MKRQPVCLLFCLILLVTFGSAAAEKPWIEVRSPHFRVLTNGELRTTPGMWRCEFEQMRYVFARPVSRVSPGLRGAVDDLRGAR